MQPAGGGAPRPGRGDGLPGSLRQLDPAAVPMLLVDTDPPEPVRSGARELALFLTPEPRAEVGDRDIGVGETGFGVHGEEWTPDPNPLLPRSILSRPARGFLARSGRREGPVLGRAVPAWPHPEMRCRSRRLSLPADTASGDAGSAPTPGTLPSSGRDAGPSRAASCRPLPGWAPGAEADPLPGRSAAAR